MSFFTGPLFAFSRNARAKLDELTWGWKDDSYTVPRRNLFQVVRNLVKVRYHFRALVSFLMCIRPRLTLHVLKEGFRHRIYDQKREASRQKSLHLIIKD